MTAQSFPAFGGTAIVAVADGSALEPALAATRAVIDEIDRACSRFREDSDLMAVNRGAGGEVEVGRTLIDALEVALGAAELTDGLVDPTVGAALLALGYDRDFHELAGRAPRSGCGPITATTIPGWRTVVVDAPRGTVRLPAGASIDLGATAKALAADRCAARASEQAGCGVLVSLSGDIAIAGAAPDGGWLVRVADDHRAPVDAAGQTIHLPEAGLASSSTTVCRWAGPDGGVHHLIDPVTGAPSEGPWRTVTVAASTCLAANIASTATIIGGRDRFGWLTDAGLPARLVGHDGTVCHLGGWPAEGDDLPVGDVPAAA